jgi:Pentapeptide repeats (8 copies)
LGKLRGLRRANYELENDCGGIIRALRRWRADFAGVDLHGVDLSNAALTEINLDTADLSRVNFSDTDLSGGDGKDRHPGHTKIRYAVLRNAIFRNADVSHVDCSHSDLSFANFIQIDSDRVIFDYACLFCAVLEEGMRIGSFEGANVEGTLLEDAEWV